MNRFYPALLRAGILTEPVDPSAGMTDHDRARFRDRGLGITNLAPRATAKASELTTEELREGGTRPQDQRFEQAELWVVPNPSGLNAHETVASLARAYAAPARAAGIL